jgi:hypothetical protein
MIFSTRPRIIIAKQSGVEWIRNAEDFATVVSLILKLKLIALTYLASPLV